MNSKSEMNENQPRVQGQELQGVNQNQQDVEFDKENQINLDKERLTYICDYCGKVNKLDSPRCARCGKRRPRTEFVKAMTAVREAKLSQQEHQAQKAFEEAEQQDNEKFLQDKKEQIMADKKAADSMAMTRIIEERVADEKQQIKAKAEIRTEQEREQAKKMAAREAVLQIIAAEKYADQLISDTEREANQALKEKDSEYKKKIAEEREKAIQIAAEKLVAERAGIEQYASEQIEKILSERDQSEKMAARRAVLQIIAAEKAAEDELRLNKEALSRAALRRIEEEKEIAQKQADAKYLAQRQGIEKATEERIRAEREAIKKLLEEKKILDNSQTAVMHPTPGEAQNKQVIQPFVIVPYVNSQQPLLQYKPSQLYKFVPNTYSQQLEAQQKGERDLKVMQEGPKPTEEEVKELLDKKYKEKEMVESQLKDLEQVDRGTEESQKQDKKSKLRVRLTAFFSALLAIGFGVALWFLPILSENMYSDSNANLNIFTGFLVLLQDGINGIIGTEIAIIEMNSFIDYITSLDFLGGVVLPFGLFVAVITYAIILIKSVIRLISGRAQTKGLFLSIFGFVLIQFIVAGVFLLTNAVEMDFLANIQPSLYILEGVGVLTLIMSIINKRNSLKNARK